MDLIRNELSSGWAAATVLIGAVAIEILVGPVRGALAALALATAFLGVQAYRRRNAGYHSTLDVQPSAAGVVLICESLHDHGDCFSRVEAIVTDPLGFRHRATDLGMNRFDSDWQVYLPYPTAFELSEGTQLIRPGTHRVEWRGQFRGTDRWMPLGKTSFGLTGRARLIQGR